jgi:hypothetical protein
MFCRLKSFHRIAPCVLAFTVVLAFGQPQNQQETKFEGYSGVLLSNDKLQLTVLRQGSAIANLIMLDDPAKLSPLWNAPRLARDAGRQSQTDGILGHFVCVDGFGPSSPEERAAGIPGHGEAHGTNFEIVKYVAGSSVSLIGKLPIVQEMFTRTFGIVKGENVIYVDSVLENLLGFDRPVNWAEHATVAAPFLEPGKVRIFLSGTRSQNRDYVREEAMARASAGQNGNPAANPGNQPKTQLRLVSGADFPWPMAPGVDGRPIDMSAIPEDPHFLDHATTLMDPSRKLEWVAALNSERHLLYGYVFRREDCPWLQHWGDYPAANRVVRGMEFGTQPYDVPRREAITLNSMFGTPTYRWLPAKSKIESHFLLFYIRAPEEMKQVDDIHLANGRLIIEDRAAKKQLNLAASRGL